MTTLYTIINTALGEILLARNEDGLSHISVFKMGKVPLHQIQIGNETTVHLQTQQPN